MIDLGLAGTASTSASRGRREMVGVQGSFDLRRLG